MTRISRNVVSALLVGLVLAAGPLRCQTQVVRVIAMPEPTDDATAEDAFGLTVNQSLWRKWTDAREEALAAGATIIVFEITTPGGE